VLSSSPELTGNFTMIPPLGTSNHLGLLASVSLKSPQPKPAISQKGMISLISYTGAVPMPHGLIDEIFCGYPWKLSS